MEHLYNADMRTMLQQRVSYSLTHAVLFAYVVIEACVQKPASAYLLLAPPSTNITFAQQHSSLGGIPRTIAFRLNQERVLEQLTTDERGILIDVQTGTRILLGQNAQVFASRAALEAYDRELYLYNVFGKRIELLITDTNRNISERAVLSETGVYILNHLPAHVTVIVIDATGIDCLAEIHSPPDKYFRYDHPYFEPFRTTIAHNESKLQENGFDISGLISSPFMHDNHMYCYTLRGKINLFDSNYVSTPWVCNSIEKGTPILGGSIISMPCAQGQNDQSVSDFFKYESIHWHPIHENIEMKELYICMQGAMGLLLFPKSWVDDENAIQMNAQLPHLLVLEPGQMFVTDAHIMHGIGIARLPYTHMVIQVPSTFHYGLSFKRIVTDGVPQFMNTYFASHPDIRARIQYYIENPRGELIDLSIPIPTKRKLQSAEHALQKAA